MSSASTGGTEGSSPASSPASASSLAAMAAPKFGTLVPNRIFVGGISASTSEAELAQVFSAYGNVKAAKIISDRAGVSKGYGFVTFETDAEARRLQDESECIILRERKLNIAPAIKKQPFNRSFDGGSGSPPAVPTSTYYYTNGMGLAYQNGLTFYNAGAPAPGTPIAPPTDPATIYQAAGVFGPQATSPHQTFAPVVYSCPAPSLYMPQQYQYSPMPYESYYAGATGGGPPQYALYPTSAGSNQSQQQSQQQQNQSNGGTIGGASSGSNNGGGGGRGNASSGTSNSSILSTLPPGATHFYAPSSAPPPPPQHHHQPVPTGPPPPPQPPLEHMYYSFAAPGPPPQTQPQHQAIGIGDQQLLLYTTDPNNCQQLTATSDTQAQEDIRSTSTHSDQSQPQQQKQQQQQPQQSQQPQQQPQSDSHQHQSAIPLMSLMPLNYPLMSSRYANYPVPIASSTIPQHHQSPSNPTDNSAPCQSSISSDHPEIPEDTGSPMHPSPSAAPTTYVYHPATVYIPHNAAYPPTRNPRLGPSLLPTPNRTYQPPLKFHPNHSKSAQLLNSAVGINLGYHSRTQTNYSLLTNLHPPQSYPKNHSYSRKYGTSHNSTNAADRGSYYVNKNPLGSQQQYSYVAGAGIYGNQILPNSPHFSTTYYNGQNYTQRRNSSDHWSEIFDSVSRQGPPRRREFSSNANRCGKSALARDPQQSTADNSKPESDESGEINERVTKSPLVLNNNNKSPPSAPYSPVTRPIPNVSPPVSQVQFYTTSNGASQARYHQQQLSNHQQSGQRRYPGIAQSGRKQPGSANQLGPGEMLRRPKVKMNGLVQVANKRQDDNCMGGGGDAGGANIGNRLPITPPTTPCNDSTSVGKIAGSVGNVQSTAMNDACHQMQTLNL